VYFIFGTRFADFLDNRGWKIKNEQMANRQLRPVIEATATAVAERREDYDRRRYSWRTVTYCGLHGRGRRRRARRKGHNYYLDWYDPKLVFTGIAVLFMSCLDALFTLTLLNKGAHEANYFMARLLETSDGLFVAVKMAVTAFGILFLLMHSHFQVLRITSGKRLLQFAGVVYGLLIGYELILLGVLRG
jgi:hypothetical protein